MALPSLRAGREVERVWLAETLWPESNPSAALYSLRRSLTDLRDALGAEAARIQSPTPHTLSFNPAAALVDVLAFDQAIARGGLPSLQEAVRLYRGPLLEGCWEDWIVWERESRRQAYLQALETLAHQARARADLAAAERFLHVAIACDPFREAALRALMETLVAQGDCAAVLAFRTFRKRLQRELGEQPDPETVALFERLRSRARRPSPPSPPSASAPVPTHVQTVPLPLPRPLTALIGREQETQEICAAVRAARLVSLIGAGGIGKTRLALEVAHVVAPEFPDGVRFVELASLTEGSLVAQAVAQALGVAEQPDRPLAEFLAERIATRSLLLVLDNCEHLLEACARLAHLLLQYCPNLHLLTTSRQALGITGELIWRVPSLPTPDPAELLSSANCQKDLRSHVLTYPAVRLFVERASLGWQDFRLTERQLRDVATICHRLDGIPLAIEMAASRMRSLPVDQIVARLDDRFRLLTDGSRTALPRHRTLRALIDWSYDLLSEPERVLLRRLSVFADGWTLDAAAIVCADGAPEPLPSEVRVPALPETAELEPPLSASQVVDFLTQLVEKSLVIYEERAGEGRYRLLETVREYARERLQEAGEESLVRTRHLACYAIFAARAEHYLWGAEQAVWLDRLAVEHHNLRAALLWSRQPEIAPEVGLCLAASLWWFWAVRGYLIEGRQQLDALLARAAGRPATAAQANALNAAGALAGSQGDCQAARAFYESSLAMYRELNDLWGVAAALSNVTMTACNLGDHHTAGRLLQEALRLRQKLNDDRGAALVLAGLARVAREQGDTAQARDLYQQTLAIRCRYDDRLGLALSYYQLGTVAADDGDYAEAERLHRRSLAMRWELRDLGGIAYSLQACAGLALAREDPTQAARLLGAAQTLRDRQAARLPVAAQQEYDRYLETARRMLGQEALLAAWQEGQTLPLERVVAGLLQATTDEPPPSVSTGSAARSPSP